MVPSLRSLLVGPAADRPGWYLELLVVVPVFLGVFAAYALGFFAVGGGVVFVPFYGAAVGLAAGVVLAALGRGLLHSWLVGYASLLGYSADHYFLGLSGRSLPERAAAFLGPDGLAFLAVLALVLGTAAWPVGALARWLVDSVRRRGDSADPG